MKTSKQYLKKDEYYCSGGLQGQCTVSLFPRQPKNNGVVCLKHIHHAC